MHAHALFLSRMPCSCDRMRMGCGLTGPRLAAAILPPGVHFSPDCGPFHRQPSSACAVASAGRDRLGARALQTKGCARRWNIQRTDVSQSGNPTPTSETSRDRERERENARAPERRNRARGSSTHVCKVSVVNAAVGATQASSNIFASPPRESLSRWVSVAFL